VECGKLVFNLLIRDEDSLFVLQDRFAIRGLCLVDICFEAATGKDRSDGGGGEGGDAVLPVQESSGIGALIACRSCQRELR